nr:hypothetical protein [uncultured organism]
MRKHARAAGRAATTIGLIAASMMATMLATNAPAAPLAAARATPIAVGMVRGPEDLELVPATRLVVVSQLYATRDHATGDLALLDTATDTVQPLPIRIMPEPGWGDSACAAPPRHIGPHGIHLSRRRDGRLRLLVVNHEERESIEFLELDPRDRQAIWRGCVRSADAFNDVVATPEGGFVATVPTAHGQPEKVDGSVGGFLVEWRPARGLRRLPRSMAAYNNGVQISPDGHTLFFAAWTARELIRYDRRRGRVTGRVELRFMPDNLAIGRGGTFLVAGIDGLPGPGTPRRDDQLSPAFTVARFDPRTMRIAPVYHGAPGEMAGASIALPVGRHLYLGSYTGRRMLKLAAPRQ